MLIRTKAVVPAASLGTRFLPETKATPKEMPPIVDKSLIEYASEETMTADATSHRGGDQRVRIVFQLFRTCNAMTRRNTVWMDGMGVTAEQWSVSG